MSEQFSLPRPVGAMVRKWAIEMSALAEKVGGLFSGALPSFIRGAGELPAVILENIFRQHHPSCIISVRRRATC